MRCSLPTNSKYFCSALTYLYLISFPLNLSYDPNHPVESYGLHPPFWMLSPAQRRIFIQEHLTPEEMTYWSPTDSHMPPWDLRSANPVPPIPTARDRYHPSAYRRPAVQRLYLASTYTRPRGILLTANPVAALQESLAASTEQPVITSWSSSDSDPDSPAFEVTGSSRNMQLEVDCDTDTEVAFAKEGNGIDFGAGKGWTRRDIENLTWSSASTVATSTASNPPTVIISSEPFAGPALHITDDEEEPPTPPAASDSDEDDFSDMPDLEPAPEFVLPPVSSSAYPSRVYQIGAEEIISYSYHSAHSDSANVPSTSVEEPDAEDEEFDIFDPPTPGHKRRRLFQSPPPQ